MKILHTVQYYHPKGGGMYEVVKQLSERLVVLGHNVIVATTKLQNDTPEIINGVKIVQFNLSGNFTDGIQGDIKKYQDFLISSYFDIVTNFAAQQPMTDATLPVLDKIKTKKVFVPTGFSTLYNDEYKEYFEKMKNWMKKYDMNIFLSNDYRDINFARENNIKKIKIIPNGASEDEFSRENNINIRKELSIPKNYFLILHVGSHTGLKGHREAIKIFSKAKIKNAVFLLIGNKGKCSKDCKLKAKLNFLPNFLLKNKKIIIKEFSRKETISAYKEANLFLFPSNIECSPIVLFEAMASKTPFLVTDVGNSSEIIKWSGGGILLPTIKENQPTTITFKIKIFLKKIGYFLRICKKPIIRHNKGISKANIKKSVEILENIYNDKEKLSRLAENGYRAWLENFTWKKITSDYENLYQHLIK